MVRYLRNHPLVTFNIWTYSLHTHSKWDYLEGYKRITFGLRDQFHWLRELSCHQQRNGMRLRGFEERRRNKQCKGCKVMDQGRFLPSQAGEPSKQNRNLFGKNDQLGRTSGLGSRYREGWFGVTTVGLHARLNQMLAQHQERQPNNTVSSQNMKR